MFYAVHGAHVALVSFLLTERADPGWSDKFGQTPFALAEQQNHHVLMELLRDPQSASLHVCVLMFLLNMISPQAAPAAEASSTIALSAFTGFLVVSLSL
jgi:hypothetical protein